MKPNIAFRYIKASKNRTTLTILGIALALALMACIGNFFSTLTYTMVQEARQFSGDYHIRVALKSPDAMRKLLTDQRVENTAYLYDVSYAETKPGGEDNPFPQAVAVLQRGPDMDNISKIELAQGRMPEKKGEIVLSSRAAELMDSAKVGEKITLKTGKYRATAGNRTVPVPDLSYDSVYKAVSTENKTYGNEDLSLALTDTKTKEYTVVGVMESSQPTQAYDFSNSSGTAIAYPEDTSKVAVVYLSAKTGVSLSGLAAELAPDITALKANDGLLYLLNTDFYDAGIPLFPIITAVFVFVSIIVGLAAVSIVRNTFSLTVTERLTDFGLLRCAGATPGQILGMLTQEVGFMLVLAVPLGLLLGTAASLGLIFIVNSMDFAGLPTIYLAVSPLYCAISVAIGLAATFIAVINPFRAVTRISPVEVTRGNRLVKLPRRATRQNRLARLVFGFSGDLSLRNMKRNGKRSRTVLVSMTICVALFLCASGLLAVFSSDFEHSSSQNNADITVYAEDEAALNTAFPKIAALKGIKRIHLGKSAGFYAGVEFDALNETLSKGGYSVFTLPTEEEPDSKEIPAIETAVEVMGRDAFTRLDIPVDYDAWIRSGGVLAYNHFQISRYDSNNRITMYNGRIFPDLKAGQDLSFKVTYEESTGKAAVRQVTLPVYAELDSMPWYQVPSGYDALLVLLVPEENARAVGQKLPYIEAAAPAIYVDAGGENVPALTERIQSLDAALSVNDTGRDDRDTQNVYLLFVLCIYGFVGVISLISCLNIINIISTNLILRRREFGLLQAVGMSVRQVRRLVSYESFLYSLKSVVYGVLIGVLLLWAFFTWLSNRYVTEIELNYFAILYAALGAFLVSFIAALPTLKRLRRMSIVETIRAID
jgi:putative ABC transport system permease protein